MISITFVHSPGFLFLISAVNNLKNMLAPCDGNLVFKPPNVSYSYLFSAK